MRRLIVTSVSTLALPLALTVSLSTSACSGGDIAVGKTDQSAEALQKKTDGTATGNGQTCSWEGTSVAAGTSASANASAAPYAVGASFKSPDGCNDCSCAAQGIMCTVMACAGGSSGTGSGSGGAGGIGSGSGGTGTACSTEAKVCPDGSSVGRTGPNCEFAPCPTGPVACPAIARQCPDGSSVSPTGPNCIIPDCPAACTKAECGPELGMPNYLCPDGKTLAGPGPCERTNGVCGYKIISCPP